MTRYKVALLSLLASAASAFPQYGHNHHHHPHPSGGAPTGTGGPTGTSTSAPYGLGNSTTAGPTGTAPLSSSSPIYSTVTVIPQPVSSGQSPIESAPVSSGLGNSPIGGSSAAGGECGPATVTVTSANTVTVTVGAEPSNSSPVGSIPTQAPVPTSSAPYGNGTSSVVPIGTGTAPVVTGSSALPSPSSPTVSISKPDTTSSLLAAPSIIHPVPLVSSTYEKSPIVATTPVVPSSTGAEFYQAPKPVSTPQAASTPTGNNNLPEQATSSVAPKSSSAASITSSDNVVARGLVYNEASLTTLFDNSHIGWQYNWDSSPGGTVDTQKEFVPMLWNTSPTLHIPMWKSNAEAAIKAGSGHLLGFNEPDLAAQANMSPGEAVAGWIQYIEPFHAQYNGAVKLGSPSVCNGPDANQGLGWLTQFLNQCDKCNVDFLAIHWYGLATDDGVQDLKDHIGKTQAMAGGRAIWLTEFQPQGSDEQQAEFLGKILPWLDDKSNGVDRYAYFKVDNMVSGSSLTQVGSAYAG